jgi:chromosome segregation ATPase
VIEVQNEKISYVQQNNDELQKIIWTLTEESEQDKAKLQEDLKDMTIKNIAWLENQLVEMRRTLHAKIAVLHQEKDATLLELHASQVLVKNSESLIEQKNEKISCLQQDKDELQKAIYTLTLELDQAKAKFQEEVSQLDKQLVEVRRSFHAKSVASHEENNITLLELQKSQASTRNFENMVGQQNEKISSLQRGNDELIKTIHILSQDSEQAKSKFQEELASSKKQLVDVRRSFQAKITALHQEKDASLLQLQKYEASMRNFECVVENKNENISSLQQGNDDLEKRISILTQDSDQAKATLQEEISMFEKQLVEVRRSLHAKIAALHERNDATLLKLHESQASVRNFENVIEQ